MSLTVNGRCPSSLRVVSDSVTTFSSRFLSALFPSGVVPPWVPVTLYTKEHGFFTVVLRTTVGGDLVDLSVGLDWSASMRELLNSCGWYVSQAFDPVREFLPSRVSFFLLLRVSACVDGSFGRYRWLPRDIRRCS